MVIKTFTNKSSKPNSRKTKSVRRQVKPKSQDSNTSSFSTINSKTHTLSSNTKKENVEKTSTPTVIRHNLNKIKNGDNKQYGGRVATLNEKHKSKNSNTSNNNILSNNKKSLSNSVKSTEINDSNNNKNGFSNSINKTYNINNGKLEIKKSKDLNDSIKSDNDDKKNINDSIKIFSTAKTSTIINDQNMDNIKDEIYIEHASIPRKSSSNSSSSSSSCSSSSTSSTVRNLPIHQRIIHQKYCETIKLKKKKQLLQQQQKNKTNNSLKLFFKDKAITLNINTLTGKSFQIEAFLTDTIADLKEIIQDREGILKDSLILIYNNTTLTNENCSLRDYKLQDGATLKLALQMSGGNFQY